VETRREERVDATNKTVASVHSGDEGRTCFRVRVDPQSAVLVKVSVSAAVSERGSGVGKIRPFVDPVNVDEKIE